MQEDPSLRRKLAVSIPLAPEDVTRLLACNAAGARGGRISEEKLRRELHHEQLGLAPKGSRLRVIFRFDNRLRCGDLVTLVRSLRRPSPRIAIRTAQGKEWWAPMDWLELVTEEE